MRRCRRLGVAFSPLDARQLATIREAAEGFEVADISGGAPEDLIAGCEIIFGYVPPEKIALAKNLKWFHATSAGVDYLLRPEYGFPGGVVLTNSSGAYGVGISEHLLAVTLMLMRRMGEYADYQRRREWRYAGAVSSIYGSRVAVVGLGDIGGAYAKRVHALGATVRGVTRTARNTAPDHIEGMYLPDRLAEALDGADVAALCLPGTADTRHIFSTEMMRAMKKGALILNIGRGSAIDQDALITLLEEGHIGGAGLDVTDPEPLPADSKLWGMPNVILTPHISGGHSLGLTIDLIVAKFARYLRDYAAGREFERAVDFNAGY